ncbi:hypothetical protein ANN_11720 [Periplaneta americana]|uniref:Uncharacterized protein n=1 Tax=Periplaneta americana TaxID=6978 RepID=A0ABQ8T7L8_PERAM|nr:hypothetical protein ANN_11720 [Periplaneta americana]
MSPGSSTESYPAFARIGLRENPGKNLNQVTFRDRDPNPGYLVSQPDTTVNKETGCSSINGTSTNNGPVKRKLLGRRITTVPVSDYESDEIELDTDYDVSDVPSIFTDSESDVEKKTKSVKIMLKAHSYMVVTYEEELWPGKVLEVKNNGALVSCIVFVWFSHFKSGNMSTEDMPRPGRPSTGRNDENIAKIKRAIEDRKTIDEVSEQTTCHEARSSAF